MEIEVELKAWVRDYEALKNRLDERTDVLYIGFEEKADTYYGLGEEALFRIRKEHINEERSVVITHKKRSTIDGIEENVEYEITVDSAQ
ncbi:MAG: hypothetical protein WCY61_05305, partial [Sphaerochaeta sp.]